MVHALRETWRVLVPGGLLIDMRPISVDVPLQVLTVAGWQSAGCPDQSPDRPLDLAADRAMRVMLRDGLLMRLRRHYFEVNNYWSSLAGLKADLDERWKDDILVSPEIWRQARRLYRDGSGKNRLRIPFRKKITVYQKVSPVR